MRSGYNRRVRTGLSAAASILVHGFYLGGTAVAIHHAVPAGFDGVLVETEVAAFEFEFGGEGDALHVFEGVFLAALQDQDDLLGLAVHREVAGHFVSAVNGFGARAFEFDGRELLRIEVVGLPEVFVAGLVGRVDAVSFDGELERRLGGVLPVERKLSLNLIEPAVNPTDVEMSRLKTDRGMDQIVGVFVRR